MIHFECIVGPYTYFVAFTYFHYTPFKTFLGRLLPSINLTLIEGFLRLAIL